MISACFSTFIAFKNYTLEVYVCKFKMHADASVFIVIEGKTYACENKNLRYGEG